MCRTRVRLYAKGGIALNTVAHALPGAPATVEQTVMVVDGFYHNRAGWGVMLAFTNTVITTPLCIPLGGRRHVRFKSKRTPLTVFVEDIDNTNKRGRFAVLFVAGSDHRAWPHSPFFGDWLGYGRCLTPQLVMPAPVKRLCGCTGRCDCGADA